MKIFILTEGGKKNGYGHLTRCTSLYDEVRKREYEVEFIVNGDSQVEGFLEGRKVTVTDWISNEFISENITEKDLVIVDSYLTSEEFCLYLTSKVKKCLFIDDNNRINYAKGIVVNPSIFGDEIKYPQTKNLKYFLGKDFIILRKSFLETERIVTEKKVKNILITMGGSDSINLTSKVLEILVNNFPDLQKKIIVGQGYTYLEELEKLVDSNTAIYQNANERLVKEFMMNTDIAITAAGQTIYELIKTSTPFIPVKVVENQRNNVEGIKKLNLAHKVLDDYTNIILFEKSLIEEMKVMMDMNNRFMFSNRMTNIIDGKGPERIIDVLLE